MTRPSAWVAGVRCSATVIATCLGATSLTATVSLPSPIASDRKGSVMVCNGGFAFGLSLDARWRRQ
jgi:hypothetical protein